MAGLTLRSQIGRKLSISEMDGNLTYLESISSGGLETLSYGDFLDLIDSGDIINNMKYLITGFDVDLFGGNDIIVSGLPNNEFTKNGIGKFYNPRYDIINVWNFNSSYSIDNLVIYGGKVWKNLTGDTGSIDGFPFTLDSNWLFMDDFTNTDHYTVVWDEIEICLSNGDYCINSRYNCATNNYVRVGQLGEGNDRWFFCGVNPLSVFGWGNNNINDCTIKDSFFNCLNVMGNTEIYGVEMSNYSYMFDLIIINSYIEGLTIKNESGFYTLTLDNSQLKYCVFNNNSSLQGSFINTTISYIDLKNSSYLQSLDFTNSYIDYLNLNNSQISSIYATSSTIRNIDMSNGAWVSNLNLNSSTVERVNLSNRSYINTILLNNSNIYEINFNNYSYIDGSQILLYSSSMTYMNLTNHSHISGNIGLTSSYFKRIDMTNRSVIQGNIFFESSNMEKLDATNDSYIGNVNLYNNSSIYNIDINGSDIQNTTLQDNSYLESLSLNRSYLSNISLTSSQINSITSINSAIYDINLSNSSFNNSTVTKSEFLNLTKENSNLYQIDLNSCSLNLSALGTSSTYFPSGTTYIFNEIKYQFVINMNGTLGNGLTDNSLNIPSMLIPYGYYINRVISDADMLIYSGNPATFSFSILGLSPSNIESSVDDISNKIKIFDISNGTLQGVKSWTNTKLSSFLSGGSDITSGTLTIEVTLKKTYDYYDD